MVIDPPAVFVLVAVKSGRASVATASKQPLLSSLFSTITLPGSTAHVPKRRGLSKRLVAFGLTGTVMVTVPFTGIVTAPDALQERFWFTLPACKQLIVPLTPPEMVTIGLPYVVTAFPAI